jgi:hypothetical protein
MWSYEDVKERVKRRVVKILEVGDMFVSFEPGIVSGRTGLMSLDSFDGPNWKNEKEET